MLHASHSEVLMQKRPTETPADDKPRDVSQPIVRSHPEQPDDKRTQAPGARPTPESDSRTHQRFSGEGQQLQERERAKNTR